MTAKKIARTEDIFDQSEALAELLQDAGPDARPQMVEITRIIPNRVNPRHEYSEDEMASLENSIRQYGFFGALDGRLLSDGTVELGPGSRRLVAAKRAGLKELPIILHEWDDLAMLTIALVENLTREDLSPLDTCAGVVALRDEYDLSLREVARRLNKHLSWVQDMVALAEAPPDVRDMVAQRSDSVRAARFISRLDDVADRQRLEEQVAQGELTTGQVHSAVKRIEQSGASEPDRHIIEQEDEAESAASPTTAAEATAQPEAAPTRAAPDGATAALEPTDMPRSDTMAAPSEPKPVGAPEPEALAQTRLNTERIVGAISYLNRLEPKDIPSADVDRIMDFLQQLARRAEVIMQELKMRRAKQDRED